MPPHLTCCMLSVDSKSTTPSSRSTAAIENYKVLKSEAQRSGEAVLKLAAEAATSKRGSHPGGVRGGMTVAPSLDGSDDVLKKKLDDDIEKLRDLLVRVRQPLWI